MNYSTKKLLNWIKYGAMSTFMAVLFMCGISSADLLWDVIEPSHTAGNTMDVGESVSRVGKNVFEGAYEVNITGFGFGAQKGPSIIVKTMRILLMMTIALSVTMILYNGIVYIVQTGQGKEAKDLTKNIAYIIIGILVGLFSVIIITLLQSVPTTLRDELTDEWVPNGQDNSVVEGGGKRMYFGVGNEIFNVF